MRRMAADQPVVPLAEGIEHDVSEWERATAAVLRKSRRLAEDAPDTDVWEALTTTTLDGLDITPLGTRHLVADVPETGLPGEAPYTRGSGTADPELEGWDVRGWFTDPATTAEHLTTELENGGNSLWLTVGERGIAADRLAELLEPVFLDLAPVVLDAPEDPVAAAEAFLAVCRDKGVQPHPLTNLGAGGTDLDTVVRVATLAKEAGVRGVVVDASALHDQGASEVQELAWSMMVAVTYVRALEAAGFTTDEAAAQLEFRYAATDEQFPTIAKLRAARTLWNRVGELSGIGEAARAQRQHAVTSRPMMARYDSYTNMLRTTVAGFAAGVGGADVVTVLPFDEPLGLPTPFSRRIARNTSSLLIHESHVAKVADPAGGAYAVEKFTDDLAMAAWELFAELDGLDELEGVADLDAAAERLAPLVEAVRDDRALQIARRQRPITGISEFPNAAETLPERTPVPGRARGLPLRRRVRADARRARGAAGVPGHDGADRGAHRARHLRHQPAGRRWDRHRRGGSHDRGRRPRGHVPRGGRTPGGLPRRHRRGLRRVGCRPGRRAARERRLVRRRRRQGRARPGRVGRHGPRRAGLPATMREVLA